MPAAIKPLSGSGVGTVRGIARPLELGVEQEFELFVNGRKADFRKMFRRSVAPFHSVRFRNYSFTRIIEAGYMLGCDGEEAEFATAPISFENDGCIVLVRETRRCREHMLDLLEAAGIGEVRGCSTHINATAPPGLEDRLMEQIVRCAGPALVLLLEGPQSPGLLVRPRYRRLEACSEYIDDDAQLLAATVFLAGVIALFLSREEEWWPQVNVDNWEEGILRGGVFLPHDAFGDSIHEHGRAAELMLTNGERVLAGDLLAWWVAQVIGHLGGAVDARALDALRWVVEVPGSLQIERRTPVWHISRLGREAPCAPAHAFGAVASEAAALGAVPEFVDWEGVAFSWSRANATRILGVPRAHLPGFLSLARAGNVAPLFGGSLAPQGCFANIESFNVPKVFEALNAGQLGEQAADNLYQAGSVLAAAANEGANHPAAGIAYPAAQTAYAEEGRRVGKRKQQLPEFEY